MLENKNIVITGASRGIGYAIAEKCMEYGADVWVCMRSLSEENTAKFKVMEEGKKGKAFLVELDLSNQESINSATRKILSGKISIDAVVNNAGISGKNRLFSMTAMNEIREVFEVNFFGPMQFTQKLLKNMMKNKRGSIINISSAAALDGRPAQFEYVSSKAAILGATKKLAEELGAFGIRINAIAPGVTETDMVSQMDPTVFARCVEGSFLKRAGKPYDVAELAAFLASDRSSYITGQTIRIDGGGN